ncbi:hypothetical protein [Parasedimentitalea maritima]|nr:hypothetical protein [Zongyanglinia marina]
MDEVITEERIIHAINKAVRRLRPIEAFSETSANQPLVQPV